MGLATHFAKGSGHFRTRHEAMLAPSAATAGAMYLDGDNDVKDSVKAKRAAVIPLPNDSNI